MENLFESFYSEMDTAVSQLEKSCIALKESPDQIDEIFRQIHNIKGMTASLELYSFTQITIRLEKLLFYIKDQNIEINDKVMEFFFEICLFMKFHLVSSSPTTQDEADPEELIKKIDLFFQEENAA